MRLAGALGLATAYVEQQAPLIDSGFFRWFFERIGGELAQMQDSFGSDWATDQLWCRAAAVYAREHLGAARRVACAVLTAPVLHESSQTIAGAHGVPHANGSQLRRWAAETWPDWWLADKLKNFYKLDVYHATARLRLRSDFCMVTMFSSSRLGPLCHNLSLRLGSGGGGLRLEAA
ncbi:hypothetical protein OAO87_03910 [bacterium]|nr:hypothetical protein [bacterium]